MRLEIKFGMPSLMELDSLNEQIALCKKLKLDFIELNMDLPDFTLDKLQSQKLKEITKKEKIFFTLHLPEKIDLGYFDKVMCSNFVGYCQKTIVLAKKAGIKLINFHLKKGTHFTLPHGKVFLYDKYEKQFLANIYNSFKIISKAAVKNKVNVHIENAYTFQFPFIAKAVDKIMKLPGIYLTWDTGHDALSDFQEQKVLMKHKPKIKHFHLHDCKGGLDHQVLYTGRVKVNQVLSFAKKQKATVVIETKTAQALKESIKKLNLS